MRVTGDEEKGLSGHPKTENAKKVSQLPKKPRLDRMVLSNT